MTTERRTTAIARRIRHPGRRRDGKWLAAWEWERLDGQRRVLPWVLGGLEPVERNVGAAEQALDRASRQTGFEGPYHPDANPPTPRSGGNAG